MLNAMVPKNTTTNKRPADPPAAKSRQASRNFGRGDWRSAADIGFIFSCFHRAMTFRQMPTNAAPWTTRISQRLLKSDSSQPINSDDMPIPTRNMTYNNATTRGRVSSSARSLANASPAVCVMWMPNPVIKNAKAAKTSPAQSGPSV